jgi:hypothetical protein
MTPLAFKSDSLVMDVRVTRHAFLFHIGEKQSFVAQAAVKHLMLSNKRETGSVVVERHRFPVDFPAFRSVAIAAVGAEILSMGRLCEGNTAQYYQYY